MPLRENLIHTPVRDEALGIGPGQFSDGLQRGLCRLGATLPFGPAAESFTALTGVSISPGKRNG